MKKRWGVFFFGLVLAAGIALAQGPPERRVALVIGNAEYADAPLANCKNDAADMAAALRKLGFTVTEKVNLDRRGMLDALTAFREGLTSQTVALCYYSGHGVAVEGRNHLIPLRADVQRERDVPFECVEVARVLSTLAGGNDRPRSTLLILDACRNNPLPKEAKNEAKGLVPLQAPESTLVAFAASERETAIPCSDD